MITFHAKLHNTRCGKLTSLFEVSTLKRREVAGGWAWFRSIEGIPKFVQELSERNFNARRNACEALLEHISQDGLVFFSDEARFLLTGRIIKQNMHYWTSKNP